MQHWPPVAKQTASFSFLFLLALYLAAASFIMMGSITFFVLVLLTLIADPLHAEPERDHQQQQYRLGQYGRPNGIAHSSSRSQRAVLDHSGLFSITVGLALTKLPPGAADVTLSNCAAGGDAVAEVTQPRVRWKTAR